MSVIYRVGIYLGAFYLASAMLVGVSMFLVSFNETVDLVTMLQVMALSPLVVLYYSYLSLFIMVVGDFRYGFWMITIISVVYGVAFFVARSLMTAKT